MNVFRFLEIDRTKEESNAFIQGSKKAGCGSLDSLLLLKQGLEKTHLDLKKIDENNSKIYQKLDIQTPDLQLVMLLKDSLAFSDD